MNSIAFLRAAYIAAWAIYIGYFLWMMARAKRLRSEMKDLKRSS